MELDTGSHVVNHSVSNCIYSTSEHYNFPLFSLQPSEENQGTFHHLIWVQGTRAQSDGPGHWLSARQQLPRQGARQPEPRL